MNSNYEYTPKSKIVFNIRVRNAEKYIRKCIESVIHQSDDNWSCRIINDASTDNTANIITSISHKYEDKIFVRCNTERYWGLANFVFNLQALDPYDIVVQLDGDDYLAHRNVVKDLRELHTRYDVIWTQYDVNSKLYPKWYHWPSTSLPDDWTRNNPKREYIWTRYAHPGHLHTFKKFLFDHIDMKYLFYNGEWIKYASEAAYYTPIIEMCHPKYRYFYDKICMYYNITDQNCTLIDDPDKEIGQMNLARYLKSLPVQQKLARQNLILILDNAQELKSYKLKIFHIRNSFPEINFYIGILHDWNVLQDNINSHSFSGIKFINLEKMLKFGYKYLDEKELKYLIALYFSKSVSQEENCLILYRKEINNWLDFNFNFLIHGKINTDLYASPNYITPKDIPFIKNAVNYKDIPGSPI